MLAKTRRYDPSLELRFSSTSEKDECEGDISNVLDSPTSAQAKKPKTMVRFPLTSRVRIIPRCDRKEKMMLWFTQEEMANIKRECIFTIKCISCENMECFLNNTEKYSARGLENQTSASKILTAEAKRKSHDAVFYEQWWQLIGGVSDNDAIAKAYRYETESSRCWAHMRGVNDELEISQLSQFQ